MGRRMATVYHEAGHAEIATVFGIEVTRVIFEVCYVRPPGGSAGCWGQAVTALSGPFAEMKFASCTPDREAALWSSAWKTDRFNALEHLRRSGRVRTLADVELLAARMVDQYWPAIVRVARALAEDGELSGARIEALMHF
jgi:hypothetical protein